MYANLVNAGDAVSRRRGSSCTSHNVDLSTPEKNVVSIRIDSSYANNQVDLLHVELGTARRASSVKSNHLSAKQVLPWGDTGRNSDSMYSAIVDNLRCAPGACIVTILLDLEPIARNGLTYLIQPRVAHVSKSIKLTIHCQHPCPSRRCQPSSYRPG